MSKIPCYNSEIILLTYLHYTAMKVMMSLRIVSDVVINIYVRCIEIMKTYSEKYRCIFQCGIIDSLIAALKNTHITAIRTLT